MVESARVELAFPIQRPCELCWRLQLFETSQGSTIDQMLKEIVLARDLHLLYYYYYLLLLLLSRRVVPTKPNQINSATGQRFFLAMVVRAVRVISSREESKETVCGKISAVSVRSDVYLLFANGRISPVAPPRWSRRAVAIIAKAAAKVLSRQGQGPPQRLRRGLTISRGGRDHSRNRPAQALLVAVHDRRPRRPQRRPGREDSLCHRWPYRRTATEMTHHSCQQLHRNPKYMTKASHQRRSCRRRHTGRR